MDTHAVLITTEECISDLEDRIMEITQSEEQKRKTNFFLNENSLRDICDNIVYQHSHYWSSRKRWEREGDQKLFEEIMAETPKPEEGNRYPGTESTEDPKQDKPKQTQTKIYYN